jgi:phospholipase/lecithinase/hemolysin
MRFLRLLSVVVCLLGLPAFSMGQSYTSIVVFGDSLSDTGNLAHLTQAKYGITLRVPGPAANYADGRTTDGLATLPAARNYIGVWIEQLAASFASKPAIINSLDGGTNFAYAFAATGSGTSLYTYGPNNVLSVPVDNMLQQVTDYLGTSPVISNKTLYVVWGGANSLLNATSASDITNAALQDVAVIQALINVGATDFLVPNLPPLGAVPRFNGSPTTSVPPTQAALGFNQALAAGLAALPAMNPGKTLHLFPLDTYTLFTSIVGPPIGSGLANVTASSQGNANVNPDTYLFWDDLHPTTAGHHLIAQAAASLLSPTPIATTTSVTSSAQNSNLSASVTFTATVVPGTGTATPTGTITFLDGATVLGTASVVTGTGSNGTATYATSTLTAGTHAITASFTGVNGFSNSTSVAYTQTVTPPSATSALSPSSITVTHGATGTSNVVITPLGGYSGSVYFACGVLPAHLTCNFSAASLTFTGTGAAQSTTLTVGTKDMTSLNRPSNTHVPMLAWIGLPFTGLLLIAARRRTAALRILCVCLMALLLGAGGCASSSNTASTGTYTVPISVLAGTSSTTLNLTVIVQ